jgi:hypothetical protein
MTQFTYTTQPRPGGGFTILRNGTPAAHVDDEADVPRAILQQARTNRGQPNWLGDTLAALDAHAQVTFDHRFVVVLAVGYAEFDAATPAVAADLALDLTRDGGRGDTTWVVYDRLTGETHRLEQHEFEGPPEASPDGLAS